MLCCTVAPQSSTKFSYFVTGGLLCTHISIHVFVHTLYEWTIDGLKHSGHFFPAMLECTCWTLKGPVNTSLTKHRMALLLKDVVSQISRHSNFSNPSGISGVIAPTLGFLSLSVPASMLEAIQGRSQGGKASPKRRDSWWRKGCRSTPWWPG